MTDAEIKSFKKEIKDELDALSYKTDQLVDKLKDSHFDKSDEIATDLEKLRKIQSSIDRDVTVISSTAENSWEAAASEIRDTIASLHQKLSSKINDISST